MNDDIDDADGERDDDERDDDDFGPDYDEDPDRDPERCCLGSGCLNPHPYDLASECFDLEMAKALMGDAP